MPSLSARALVGFLKLARAKRVWSDPAAAERHLHNLATRPGRFAPPRLLRSDVAVEADRRGGWPIYTLRPANRDPRGAMVYAHGGGWVHEISGLHWRFLAQVAAEAGIEVVVPIYPLAPFGTAGEVVPVVADLVEEARQRHGSVIVGGDSAGGQIALSAALLLRDQARPAPDLTLLIAPALDSSLTNPDITAVELVDPWLGVEGTRVFVEAWRGDLPVNDPMVSPLEGDMTGLGPVTVYCGTVDIVDPDVRLLVAKLQAAGVRVYHHEGHELIHAYPLLPIREGAQARLAIVREIAEAVRRASADRH